MQGKDRHINISLKVTGGQVVLKVRVLSASRGIASGSRFERGGVWFGTMSERKALQPVAGVVAFGVFFSGRDDGGARRWPCMGGGMARS